MYYVAKNYALLPCGVNMGDGYGPIVVRQRRNGETAKSGVQRTARPTHAFTGRARHSVRAVGFNASTADETVRDWLRSYVIAVPGEMTSAFLALQLFVGEFDHVVVPFDKVLDAVEEGRQMPV
jgi:predicted solute-binding protein